MTDYQRWIKRVRKQATTLGWEVSVNGHIKFRSPAGQVVVCSASPRNPHTIHNVRRDLLRAGFDLAEL